MKNLFPIGELSRLQNISKQTLIFYDKIGLFCPAYVDPNNGYRYYSANQLDFLDAILIMKRIGFSLSEIKDFQKQASIQRSLEVFKKQLTVIDQQIDELRLIKSRVEHRCRQMEQAVTSLEGGDLITLETQAPRYILTEPVEPPYSLDQVSLATKKCFADSFQQALPIYFQSGVIVPYDHILQGRYTEATYAFLPIEQTGAAGRVLEMPGGVYACIYHVGEYAAIGRSYEALLAHCQRQGWQIGSDAYEFCINDYISSHDESEYITKICFHTIF